MAIGTGTLALTYPISPSPNAVNQTRFPGPGHIHQTYGIVVAGTKYSVNDPIVGSYFATLPAKCSENHIIPFNREISHWEARQDSLDYMTLNNTQCHTLSTLPSNSRS